MIPTHTLFLWLPLMKVISVLSAFFSLSLVLLHPNTAWTCCGYWHSGDCPVSIRFSFEWIVFRCTGKKQNELCTHIQSPLICLDVSSQWCVRERASTLATFNGNDVFCHSTFFVVPFSFSLLYVLRLESFFIKLCTVQYFVLCLPLDWIETKPCTITWRGAKLLLAKGSHTHTTASTPACVRVYSWESLDKSFARLIQCNCLLKCTHCRHHGCTTPTTRFQSLHPAFNAI